MRVLDRIDLIEKIGRELQRRMTFSDIDVYLTAYGIDCKHVVPSANSKYVYVKEVLAEAPETVVLEIADELGIHHTYSVATKKAATCWKPGHFRLFLTHLSSLKKQASMLQGALRKYGISTFVAHEDIEPSKEWQAEIESALHTMDGLAAVLMPGIKESSWCDQEIGMAIGKDVLVIPVRRGLDPYGFIGKYQGIQASGKTVGKVAEEIWQTLLRSNKTAGKALTSILTQLAQSIDITDALEKTTILSSVSSIPPELLESARDQVRDNLVLAESQKFVEAFNSLLAQYGVEPNWGGATTELQEWDDDIPF